MDQDILSLKNIYRFLTVYDYPVYSIGIIREEDRVLEALINLPCHILITAERLQLEGFEEIYLGNISADSTLLIFQDNYGMLISEQDCQIMERLFEQKNCFNTRLLCHLGRMAAQERWMVEELERKIAGQEIDKMLMAGRSV